MSKLQKREKINSVVIALFLALPFLCYLADQYTNINNPSVWLTVVITITAVVVNRTVSKNIGKLLVFSSVILLVIVYSIYFNGHYAQIYSLDFIVFGLCSMYLATIKIQHAIVLEISIYINILFLFFYYVDLRQFFMEKIYMTSMTLAYLVLPTVVLAIIISFYPDLLHNSSKKIVVYIGGIIGLYILLFECSTRGPLICIFFTFVFLIIRKFSVGKNILLLLFCLLLCLLLLLLYKDILYVVRDLLLEKGISNEFLNKIIMLIEKGDTSNGRIDIYKNALSLWVQSPIIGHGIGMFEGLNNGVYAHNIFLQILCEFGFFGLIIFCSVMFKYIKWFETGSITDEKLFAIFCFSITIPRLLVSYTFWYVTYFWYLLYLMILKFFQRKNVKEEYDAQI